MEAAVTVNPAWGFGHKAQSPRNTELHFLEGVRTQSTSDRCFSKRLIYIFETQSYPSAGTPPRWL